MRIVCENNYVNVHTCKICSSVCIESLSDILYVPDNSSQTSIHKLSNRSLNCSARAIWMGRFGFVISIMAWLARLSLAPANWLSLQIHIQQKMRAYFPKPSYDEVKYIYIFFHFIMVVFTSLYRLLVDEKNSNVGISVKFWEIKFKDF